VKRRGFAVLAVGLLLGCAPTNPLVNKPAPPIAGQLLQGDVRSLADARGKLVMVYFWASYCDPCKRSFPKYQAIPEKYPGDVVLLAVSADPPEQKEERLNAFLTAMNAKGSAVWDPQVPQTWPIPGVPTIVLIDRQGIVRAVFSGYTDRGPGWIAERLDKLREAGTR
jgi:cytochrome c biogenesis protein CcmG/thiol:disulfide interchange protein DsbE